MKTLVDENEEMTAKEKNSLPANISSRTIVNFLKPVGLNGYLLIKNVL